MTSRAHTWVEVDAATVFAEGRLSGFRDACNMLEKANGGLLNNYQRRVIDQVLRRCADKAGDAPWWRDEYRTLMAQLSVCELSVPPSMAAKVREARAIVIHNAWLAQQGRPADLPNLPPREQLLSRIHAYLIQYPDTDNAY